MSELGREGKGCGIGGCAFALGLGEGGAAGCTGAICGAAGGCSTGGLATGGCATGRDACSTGTLDARGESAGGTAGRLLRIRHPGKRRRCGLRLREVMGCSASTVGASVIGLRSATRCCGCGAGGCGGYGIGGEGGTGVGFATGGTCGATCG